MVRFIILSKNICVKKLSFIYIPIWLDLLLEKQMNDKLRIEDLHSNMVRFIIKNYLITPTGRNEFTFQYG